VGMSSPSPSETDFGDAVSSTISSFCCASGSFRTLRVPCESPIKILYPILFIASKESRSMRKISLWSFGSDCLSSTFQCSVLSPGLRLLIHVSSSSWIWTTLSLVLRATLAGLGNFLTSVAFSLSPVPSL
jgi:hypothetical protein